MEKDCVQCLSTPDGFVEEKCWISHHLHRQFSKLHLAAAAAGVVLVTSVHELLECPVCTNSMYPPIHQIFHCFGQYFCLHFEALQLGIAPVYMAFLRFMGDETEARSYGYSLEVGANGRKLVWEGTPRNIRDSHKKVREPR